MKVYSTWWLQLSQSLLPPFDNKVRSLSAGRSLLVVQGVDAISCHCNLPRSVEEVLQFSWKTDDMLAVTSR